MCLGSFRGENLESFGRELWPKEESNFWQALSVEGFLRTIWYFLKSNFYPGPAIPCILGNVEKWISFIHEFFYGIGLGCPGDLDGLPGSSVHGIFQARNIGVGYHFLLQGIFPTQGSNPRLLCLLHWQAYSLPLHHLGSPSWLAAAAAAAKSLQSRPTLCDPRDGNPPGSPVPEILQARTLEWVAISFSSAWKWKAKGKSLSRVWLFATPWTLSMGFSRQEYWRGVP